MRNKLLIILLALTGTLAFAFGLTACENNGNGGVPHSHAYSSEVIAPTCTEKGYTLYTCDCGYSYKDNETNALGHNFIDYISDGNATCEEDGTKTAKCERCGQTESIADEGTALGHNYHDGICATCGEGELEYTLNQDKQSYSVSGIGNAKGTDIIIIPEYKGKPVTSIGDSAFKNCSELASITLPDSIETIGSYAFYKCSGVTEFIIPDNVTLIGDRAFSNCTGLVDVKIGTGVRKIDTGAFTNCNYLSSLVIPDNVMTISSNAFMYCSALTTLTIGDGVKSIGASSFSGCDRLENVTMPALAIGYIATSQLKTLVISSGDSIGVSAFSKCSKLASVVLPDSLTLIDKYAFRECTALTEIIIPKNVTTIDAKAFYGCSGFEKLDVTEGNSVYHGNGNCLIETQSKTLILGCKNSIIPDDGSVTQIGSAAFENCIGLTSIVIPESVKQIGSSAFLNCSALTSITVPFVGAVLNGSENTYFGYIFGAPTYSYNSTYVPETLKTVVITGGNSIDKRAFYKCRGLTEIVLPQTAITIGDYAFSNCDMLSDITLSNGLTKIGAYAFEFCSSLTDISIPDNVTEIGEGAFSCSGLTDIKIPYGVKVICKYVFSSCLGLTSVALHDNISEIEGYAFYDCSGLKTILIGGGVAKIGSQAFSRCSNIEKVYYNGTEEGWNSIIINLNSFLTSAVRYYYSEGQPTEEGNFWHYVDGEVTEW